jgi:hypothetical protein
MSEVLSVVKDSPETPKDASQNPKVIITAALLTAITTILVSFIGIVPQLRRGDTEEIRALKQDVELLKGKPAAAVTVPSISSDRKMSFSGTATTLDGKRTLNGFEVFLLPEGYSLTTKTDDSGKFAVSGIPLGKYSIIIRDSTQGTSGKGLLDESEDEVKVMGARIKYRLRQ